MADNTLKVAIISGSLRKGSYNPSLARFVAKSMSNGHSVEIDEISLNELDLPMFSEDLEADGLPASAIELKDAHRDR